MVGKGRSFGHTLDSVYITIVRKSYTLKMVHICQNIGPEAPGSQKTLISFLTGQIWQHLSTHISKHFDECCILVIHFHAFVGSLILKLLLKLGYSSTDISQTLSPAWCSKSLVKSQSL